MPDLPPDAELIAQIRDADEEIAHRAFSALFTAYWVDLCEWAYYFTRDQETAQELVADVFANIWHRRQSWTPQDSIRTYLYGAVRTQMRYQARNANRRGALIKTLGSAEDIPGIGVFGGDTQAAAEGADLRARLDHAMSRLSGRARAALVYRFYDGLDYREIADRLGATEKAARLLIERSFKSLRKVAAKLG